MIRILFVCYGNICRSPMAEFIFKQITKDEKKENEFFIASCATSREEIGNDIYPPAKRILEKHHIPFERRGARQITKEDYEDFDYIIGMDESNRRRLNQIFDHDPKQKISLLLDYTDEKGDIADPWYTDDFETAFQQIQKGCVSLFAYIME